jgi:hypothetical protein
MTTGICSLSIRCDVGIERVMTSMPNFLSWLLTWGINTFLERSDIFISPPKSFRRSLHE